jgi:hypothetical protein
MNRTKIVEALSIMGRNSNKITEVVKQDEDFFSFKYLESQVWAVAKPLEGEIWVQFYPKIDRFDGNAEYVEYRKSDFAAGDPLERSLVDQTFEHLFSAIRDKYYRVDDALDAIIENDTVAAR